jgi:hypothetical protein
MIETPGRGALFRRKQYFLDHGLGMDWGISLYELFK